MTRFQDKHAVNILLVEDNPGDVMLTREALKDSKLALNLHVVTSGDEAMEYLQRRERYARAPRPDLVLLDLNLPGMDGREVLEQIKQDDRLKSIAVVILTSSSAEEDILNTYHLQANCFVQKPLGFEEFARVVRSIKDFWFTVVKLPNPAGS